MHEVLFFVNVFYIKKLQSKKKNELTYVLLVELVEHEQRQDATTSVIGDND